MKLVIVSGLSGSGKTVALRTLEDAGFYCIDNLPLGMLPDLVDNMLDTPLPYDQTAIAIDARSGVDNSERFREIIDRVSVHPVSLELLFVNCDTSRLLKRFSETRRKHPLSREGLPLADAIQRERQLLKNLKVNADLEIDTTDLNVHQLRQIIIDRVIPHSTEAMGILIQSFGFKNGVPADTDFVFDVRCLPNPHWNPDLQPLSGRERAVIKFLESHSEVEEMFTSIDDFLRRWTPRFEAENRSYMTISIGCTGGKHRSVYLAERLVASLKADRSNVSVRHRDMIERQD